MIGHPSATRRPASPALLLLNIISIDLLFFRFIKSKCQAANSTMIAEVVLGLGIRIVDGVSFKVGKYRFMLYLLGLHPANSLNQRLAKVFADLQAIHTFDVQFCS